MVTISCSKCRNVPELPEVETVVRSIARIVGRRIVSAEFTCARILRGDPDQMSAMLAGRRIRAIRRRGKFIVIELDAGHCLVVHLGMTGKLLLGGTPSTGACCVTRTPVSLGRSRSASDCLRAWRNSVRSRWR